MNRSKWIKEIIGGAIKEHGFEYEGGGKDEYIFIYSFQRRKGDLRQYISIAVKDNKADLTFSTNAYGQKEVHGSGLMESNFEMESDNRYIAWKDAEEFKQVLYHFREIILKKGMDVLEEISRPTTEVRPKKETHWKLYQEHEALNEEYRKKYGLENIESTKELMQKISDIIVGSRDKEFTEVEEMLIGLAAVFGDQLVIKCGGEWFWNPEVNTCTIKSMNGIRILLTENPLARIINYWKCKSVDPNILINSFKKTAYDIIT